MKLLACITPPHPALTFSFLRIMFFLLSFVLEDAAVRELAPSPRQARVALSLVASSYVTWTYQAHTFSNSIETLAVLWALVLLQRVVATPAERTPWLYAAVLGAVSVFGVFNRITFPAFLVLPGITALLPYLLRKPLAAVPLLAAAGATTAVAVWVDSEFYGKTTLTVLNNVLYNVDTGNLAQHGLHPRYTHLLVNLPQLLGPALLAVRGWTRAPALAALGGAALLSALPHQEARFLLPCVPLLLAGAQIPRRHRAWLAAWVLFNSAYGVFLGVFHQAGIVPAQHFLARSDAARVVYWKTYNPPAWLFGARGAAIESDVLMGAPVPRLVAALDGVASCAGAYLVAPLSATALDALVDGQAGFRLEQVWITRRHLNMDDLEFGDDGVADTVKRVLGRRGLGVWKVSRRECE